MAGTMLLKLSVVLVGCNNSEPSVIEDSVTEDSATEESGRDSAEDTTPEDTSGTGDSSAEDSAIDSGPVDTGEPPEPVNLLPKQWKLSSCDCIRTTIFPVVLRVARPTRQNPPN